MIAAWMLYSVLIGVLAGLAALGLERALRLNGRPARLVWGLALLSTVGLPALLSWWPREASAPGESLGAAGPTGPAALEPLWVLTEFTASPPTAFLELNTPLTAFWIASSLAALILLGCGSLRLLRRVRSWRRVRVDDVEVLVSDDFGPALVGISKPEIVLPNWALQLAEEERTLILRHEQEHRTAGDTRLLTAAAGLLAAMPWNPALLWQLRRLRRAVEMDCDRRVLRRGVSPVSYGRLLLELGARSPARAPLVATLTEPVTFLERRIQMITGPTSERIIGKTALALGLAALAVVAACEAPAPTEVPEESAAALEQAIEAAPPESKGVLTKAEGPSATSPLIVVDGVITSNGLADIDALDVKSIEVVKGQAALELFGERARNGLINITTKDGDESEGDEVVFEARELPPEPPTNR